MKWLKNFFTTTSSERNGFFVLLSIIACLSVYYIIMHINQPQLNILEYNTIDNNRNQDTIATNIDQIN